MKKYAEIYSLYTSTLVKFLRIYFFLIFTLSSVYFYLNQNPFLKIPVFLLGILIIKEIFFRFYVYRKKPFKKVSENDGTDVYSSFTLNALRSLGKKGIILEKALKEAPVKFLLEKAQIKKDELKNIDLNPDELASFAFGLIKNINDDYVTVFDLFTSYLLMTEEQTKLLFSKEIKKEELLNIVVWTRRTFPKFDRADEIKPNFYGEGIAEDWVFGWTIETKKYTFDLTSEIAGKNFNLYDRQNEYQRIIEAIAANKSVLMVGEPGVGKKSIINQFGYDSFSGKLSSSLNHKRFFQLKVDSFLAGAQNQGELEQRLDLVISELVHTGNVIIFIQDFENVLGNSSYKLDLSASLIPYLQKGLINLVATTTEGGFKRFIEPMHELLGSFEVIKVCEPTKEILFPMIFEKANQLEKDKEVKIYYKAIDAAVDYGAKYTTNLVLPGAACVLLEDTVSSNILVGKKEVTDQDVLSQTQKKTKVKVGEPQKEEKQVLLKLEETIHKRVIAQKEAVSAVSEAIRRVRSGLNSEDKPISLLFLGPTGVGKTETAKALAEAYFQGEANMIRFDMSEFSNDDGVERLLGEEGLTDKVFENPSSLILLDEFEKANQNVLNLFLQVFDDGRLTDNKGKTVSFLNCIIIATSNAGSELIREEVKKGTSIDKTFQQKLFEYLQIKGIFKPELLNRFDEIITFKPLGDNELSQIIKIVLEELKNKIWEKDIEVTFDEKVISKIAKEGFDEQFGARPIRRFIQDNIEDLFAQKLLKEEIKRGEKYLISVSENNEILFIKVS